MTSTGYWIAALLLLAAGLALLGIRWFILGGHQQLTEAALQSALRPRDSAPPPARRPQRRVHASMASHG